MSVRSKLVVGNWKMNGSRQANAELLAGVAAAAPFRAEVAVCPPSPYLAEVSAALAGGSVSLGAQDCSAHEPGAYTGEVAALMLREMGCDQLSDVELEHLLVDVLKVYPKAYTARKNLRKQFYESKRFKTL